CALDRWLNLLVNILLDFNTVGIWAATQEMKERQTVLQNFNLLSAMSFLYKHIIIITSKKIFCLVVTRKIGFSYFCTTAG
ncbi:hypothetical protein L9F63_026988, partial [Diploptera punctata]